MPARPARIRLDGYADAEAIGRIFMSAMVDVAHIDEVTPSTIFVVPDETGDINLDDPKDVEWLTQVIGETLREHGEHGVRMAVEHR